MRPFTPLSSNSFKIGFSTSKPSGVIKATLIINSSHVRNPSSIADKTLRPSPLAMSSVVKMLFIIFESDIVHSLIGLYMYTIIAAYKFNSQINIPKQIFLIVYI